jgi:hypothetical protein
MARQTAAKVNWRDFPLPKRTGEQQKQLNEILLKNINQVFEQDFENWEENYREAVQGKS